MSEHIKDILQAFDKVTKDPAVPDIWIRPYQKPTKSHLNNFVFFFKPEVTDVRSGVKLEDILNDCVPLLEKGAGGKPVFIGGIRVLGGSYLDKHNIMTQHYGVIAKISREGVSAISESALQTLKSKFSEISNWSPEYFKSHVIGGHQFLSRFPEFNAFSLLALNDNIPTIRLGPGTYAHKIKIRGENFIILNPFHPYQVVPYNSPGNAVIVFECLSELGWADLRTKIAGPTDPATAPEGSVRNYLLKEKTRYGLESVDRGSNGIHMSAGPLEGMLEIQRFFSDFSPLSFTDVGFGILLNEKGIQDTNRLASNPDVEYHGKKQSLFDITEEKDATEAAEILVSLKV